MCSKEKKCLDKINVTKNALLFLSRVTTHHSFPFNPQFLYELEHMAHLSKTMCGIFNFCFRLVFIKFYIFVHKKHGLWRENFITPFKIKIIEKPGIVLLPDLWFLSSQQGVLKVNDIRMSWSSLKNDLETNFLNLENWSFEYVTFSQQ